MTLDVPPSDVILKEAFLIKSCSHSAQDTLGNGKGFEKHLGPR